MRPLKRHCQKDIRAFLRLIIQRENNRILDTFHCDVGFHHRNVKAAHYRSLLIMNIMQSGMV